MNVRSGPTTNGGRGESEVKGGGDCPATGKWTSGCTIDVLA
jgi:hypothetical protein